MAKSSTRRATQSTFTSTSKPSTVYYATGNKLISLRSPDRAGFIYIPPDPVWIGKTITSAKLQLMADVPSAAAQTFRAQPHNRSAAGYSKTNANNDPTAMAGTAAVSVSLPANTRTINLNVLAATQAIAAGGPYYGWLVSTTLTSAYRNLRGAMATSGVPAWIVTYTDPTPPPVTLQPSGNVVSTSAPTVTWTAADNVEAFQVQVSTTGTFTEIAFDSGTVSTAQDGSVALAAAGWGGVADQGTWRWRVRRIVDGVWSDWIESDTVTRVTLPTINVTSPTAISPDPTPLTKWATTGGSAQTSFQVTRTPDGSISPVSDSGRIVGPDTSWDLAAGASNSARAMVERIRVWDNRRRADLPDDRPFAEKLIPWTWTPTGAAAKVTTLTATPTPVGVGATLQWSWTSSLPTSWYIWRNGEMIAKIDGDEGQVGSTWTWCDDGTAPVGWTEYAVVPDGVNAYTQAHVIRIFLARPGFWVGIPGTDKWFCLADDAAQLPQIESSAIFQPLYGTRTIKRHYALRGREGTFAGPLVVAPDVPSVEQQIATIDWMRTRPLLEVRLAWGDICISAILRGLTRTVDMERARAGKMVQQISAEAYQCDDIVGVP